MRAGLSVYELGVHPHLIAAVLFAPLQHIAHAEVPADLLHVYGLALIGEGGAARDHERAADPREARSQPLGEDIGKIILPRIAAQIGKGEHDNGKPRRCRRHLGPLAGFTASQTPAAITASATSPAARSASREGCFGSSGFLGGFASVT